MFRPISLTLFLLSSLFVSVSASAQEEERCVDALVGGKWTALLDEVDQTYASGDFRRASALLDYAEPQVLCLNRIAQPT